MPPSGDRQRAARRKGTEHYCQGQWEAAEAEYSRAIALNPKDAVSLSNRSATYMALRRHDQALADARAAAALRPDWPRAHYRIGTALQALGQYSQARKSLNRCLKLRPLDQAAHLKLYSVVGWGGTVAEPPGRAKAGSANAGTATRSDAAATAASFVTEGLAAMAALAGHSVGSGDDGPVMFGSLPSPEDPVAVCERLAAMKEEGNGAHSRRAWDAAVRAYSEAIQLVRLEHRQCPGCNSSHSNRVGLNHPACNSSHSNRGRAEPRPGCHRRESGRTTWRWVGCWLTTAG